mmetsp:Transcript_20463/g.23606  ORF Transcript_20463/g.23606 Transcript_20463/m.23606 type:complete len:402 (+) Transcript_20463:30-1235(+)|eukprot:CAMPEP_0176425806 /NCGR_PEP_ID=MMETSP0127-20121128/11590_1 /TAXON_ID=938130 /ORGANISM="Platyophrya macrostoma, Strain WH" /LENGTH=401 /DNA_ID=CAMNT_0017807001 /DNA_START=30 /DNA_END=1235 /DNA_ORIENTATION=-
MQKKSQKIYTPKPTEEEAKNSYQNGGNNYRDNGQQRDGEKKAPIKLPGRYKIAQSDEKEFDLETCMENFKLSENPYEKESDYYFDSYSHFHIHEDMLKDKVRTLAYMNAITKNPEIIKDKIVLDIGCGTGILSIFAARAGAKHVYGIDNAGIANHARKIIEENGFADKITIIKGKVEEVVLPVDKVDIIVSEWMGYFLLYESMLDTVLFARDKWLAEDGILMPDRSVIYLTAIEDGDYKAKKINFWDDVYGVSMKTIKSWALLEPLVDTADKEQINTDACAILDLDHKTMKASEVEFASKWQLTAKRKDKVHALVAWFDVFFSFGGHPVRMSTSPMTKSTHWKQTIFYLNDVIDVKKDDKLQGSIAVKKSRENPRALEIKLSYHVETETQKLDKTQFYSLM